MTNFKGTKGKWNHFEASSTNNIPTTIYIIGENENKWLSPSICCLKLNEERCRDSVEQQYNALLISKAPEMLEMLDKLTEYYKSYNSNLLNEAKQLIIEATKL